MYSQHPGSGNRFLYHWISPERLGKFVRQGVLKPYWRHWVYDLGGFVRGISASPDPVDWMPREDEGVPGEACLVIDRKAFDHRAVELWSTETYHLTKEILLARRNGRSIDEILARIPDRRAHTWATMDETFIIDPVPARAIAAIGYEPNRMWWEDLRTITDAAEQWSIPLVRMDGWLEDAPHAEELDEVMEQAIENPDRGFYWP